MLCSMDKGRIIGMKQAMLSNHEIARLTGHDRKTIRRVWDESCALSAQLARPEADLKTIQAKMTEEPKYPKRQGVYDNMRNVVTNCFSGNEKGHVEGCTC